MLSLMPRAVVNRVKKFFGPSEATIRARKNEIKLEAALNRVAKMKARYDAAQTTSENMEHWSYADDLSARAANSLPVRRLLRRRARYEAQNNSILAGMLLTLANDTIGSGPRLQMRTGNPADDKLIQREFAEWSREVRLAMKLRTMVVTRVRDGECFAKLYTNPRHRTAVWLDFETIESDQVTTPTLVPSVDHIDGIIFDEWAQPSIYEILTHHPGDDYVPHDWFPRQIPAADVMHWFRVDRPGQRRGIPEITPALPLFSMLRRYTLAVISCAETAANHAGVLEAGSGVDPTMADGIEPFSEVATSRNNLVAVPFGWKLSQLHAEQPTQTYSDFKHEILNEIARCLNMPFNIAAGNSSGYNYSSGRLDHQVYFKAIGVSQSDCEHLVLDHLFRAWYAEANLVRTATGERIVPQLNLDYRCWQWAWDPAEDIDPNKTATARMTDLQTGSTNFQRIFAQQGLDWETEMDAQAEALGINRKQYQALLRQKIYGSALAGSEASTIAAARRRRSKPSLFGGTRRRVRASKVRAAV